MSYVGARPAVEAPLVAILWPADYYTIEQTWGRHVSGSKRLPGKRMSTIQRLGVSLWLCAPMLLISGGCRSLPESGVESFASATSTLRSTLSAAGSTAAQDVADIHDGTAASQDAARALAAELTGEWASRLKVLEAMDRYAASLSALVESGRSGQENASNFINSLQGLAAAVEVAVPPSAALSAALEIAQRAYGRIAEHLAAGQIHEAVERADPAVSALAGLISQDLIALRSIAAEKRRTALTQLRARSPFIPQLNSLKRARAAALEKVLSDDATPASSERLRQLNEAHAAITTDADYIAFAAQEAQIERVFQARADLLEQAAATLDAWAAAHHELALGLRQKRAPSLNELSRLAADLHQIYADYRKSRSAAARGSAP
jgi:hypothetical protein